VHRSRIAAMSDDQNKIEAIISARTSSSLLVSVVVCPCSRSAVTKRTIVSSLIEYRSLPLPETTKHLRHEVHCARSRSTIFLRIVQASCFCFGGLALGSGLPQNFREVGAVQDLGRLEFVGIRVEHRTSVRPLGFAESAPFIPMAEPIFYGHSRGRDKAFASAMASTCSPTNACCSASP